ncbi:MAG: response regulator, partial [Desulfobacteraceae bacterium]|nr:response regulator [Desulfobacteraceae bacterium]
VSVAPWEEEDFLHFAVSDTGIGITPERLGTIFDPFIQADSSTSRKYGGTGLGTTISKQLVQMMDGEIGVKSSPFEGSTFWFTAVFEKDLNALKKKTETITPVELNNLKVLVVDDNTNNRFVFTEHLKSWGCNPAEALDANEALLLLKDAMDANQPFELILSDFQMPRMNGFQFVVEIKKIQGLEHIPIVILVSMGMVGDRKICKELGIQGYLSKPLKRKELKAAITSILSSQPIEDQTWNSTITKHTISEIGRQKIQVLLAEDYPTNQQIVIRHLTNHGYQVSLAENGQQAVDLFKNKQFNLVLMDIQMPILDGYQATCLIREHEKKSKALFLQARSGKEDL